MRSAVQADRGPARVLQGLPAEAPEAPVLSRIIPILIFLFCLFRVFRRHASRFGSFRKVLIEQPDAGIEDCGKAAPRQVRDEQPCGCGRDTPEDEYGRRDECDKYEEHAKGETNGTHAKEGYRPGKVQDKLGGKEDNSRFQGRAAGAVFQDEEERDTHEEVEHGPGRGKDPCGRGKGGFYEKGIPSGEASVGEERANEPDDEGSGDTDDKEEGGAEPEGVHGCRVEAPGDEGDGG